MGLRHDAAHYAVLLITGSLGSSESSNRVKNPRRLDAKTIHTGDGMIGIRNVGLPADLDPS
jgi:hypothetical protein